MTTLWFTQEAVRDTLAYILWYLGGHSVIFLHHRTIALTTKCPYQLKQLEKDVTYNGLWEYKESQPPPPATFLVK